MCHAIVWYHALCQHQDQAQTCTIPCFYATASGYVCHPHCQPIIDLPLSGECHSCKSERKWQEQAQMQRKHTDNPPVIADVDVIAGFDVDETDVERGVERSSQIAKDGYMHLWIGGADILATESRVDTYSDLEGGLRNSWYEADDDEYEEEVDLEAIEHLLPSSACSEMEYGRDGCESSADGDEFLKSSMLGYAGSWDLIMQQSQRRIPTSRIPVSVSRDKLVERVWTADELELFDRLTF